MIPVRGLIQTMKGWLGKPVADATSDPQRVFGSFLALPNPDPILREMGQAERVYASIAADPHVLGDIRARDARDSGRGIAPLRQAEDAELLDTSALDIATAVAAAIALVDAHA